MEQTVAQVDLSGTDAGHLVAFDVRERSSWEERVFREDMHDGKRITSGKLEGGGGGKETAGAGR